jgi:C4-dicarboxylate-specific signal transduction histidine kinase
MPHADADWHEANDRKVIEAGRALGFEEQSELQGRTITWLTTKFPLRDASGRIYAVGGISTDITDRKNAEMSLKIAHDELELRVAERTKELASLISQLQNEIRERELAEETLLKETAKRIQALEVLREKEQMLIQQSRQAAMGEMIGNIAHQWRQPLNTLGLYTQRLGLFYDSPSFNKEYLDNSIAKSMEIIKHMSKTIDDFRDYFKPEREKTDFYVIDAIKSTLSLLEGNFHNPKITVDFVESDNPVISGYQNEFSQVFLNILNNARDAIIERDIADARVTITICNDGNCAVVTVRDNAGGIPDEIINKVFDPYFTTKGPQVGTGIGLFMSKTIIEKNMGGRLTVRNNDSGAEFRIEMEHGDLN